MLFKTIDYATNPGHPMKIWRYWCDCMDPGHCVEFIEDLDINGQTFSIGLYSTPDMTLWCRIKNALKLLFGKQVCYIDVILEEKDRQELSIVIKGDTGAP